MECRVAVVVGDGDGGVVREEGGYDGCEAGAGGEHELWRPERCQKGGVRSEGHEAWFVSEKGEA